jgi:hypothetical protein
VNNTIGDVEHELMAPLRRAVTRGAADGREHPAPAPGPDPFVDVTLLKQADLLMADASAGEVEAARRGAALPRRLRSTR